MSTNDPQHPLQTRDPTITMPTQQSPTIPLIDTSSLTDQTTTSTIPPPTSSSQSPIQSTLQSDQSTPSPQSTITPPTPPLNLAPNTSTETIPSYSPQTPQVSQSTLTPQQEEKVPSSATRNAVVSGASGVISGFLATVLLHPLEVFKIRLQGDAAGKASYRFTLRDVIKVSRKVGLYTGISANLIASMVAWGVFFGTNDYLRIHGRQAYTEYRANQSRSPTGLGAAVGYGNDVKDVKQAPQLNYFGVDFATSMLASTIAQVATQPLWLMKTRMSLDQIPLHQGSDVNNALRHAREVQKNSPYRSLWRGLAHTGRTEGIRGLYRGFSASLLGTTHGAIMMCSYTYLKELKVVNEMLDTQPEWLKNIILPSYAAFMSKVIATIVTYPTQVLRTSIQDHRVAASGDKVATPTNPEATTTSTKPTRPPQQPHFKPSSALQPNYSLWQATKDIWHSSGIKGFYRGVSMQVLRASLQNVVVFGVYEGSRRFIVHETGVGGAESAATTSKGAGLGAVKKD